MEAILTNPEIGNLIFWDRDASHIEGIIKKLNSNDLQPSVNTVRIKIDDDYYFTNEIKVLPILSELMPGTIKSLNEELLQITTRTNDISISKFYTIEGEEVKISELIKKHNLFKGKKNSPLSIMEMELLKTYEKEIIEKESFWVNEISKINLPDLPFKTKNNKSNERYCTLFMNYTTDLKNIEMNGVSFGSKEYASSLLVLFIGLTLTKNNYTIGGFNFKLKKDIMPIFNLFASIVPINFEINFENKLYEEIIKINSAITQSQINKTFYKDLAFRHPQLQQIKHIQYPISIAFAENIKEVGEIEGSDLTIIFTGSKGCYWHFNSTLFTEKDIKRIQRQFKTFLDESIISHQLKLSSYNLF